MENLARQRAEIDAIDDEILKLLRKRAEKCKKIKEIKERHKLPTQDKKREEEILEKCKTGYEHEIYKKILQQSRKLQA